MRKLLLSALALGAFAVPVSSALAQAPAPPTTPVTDDNGASALTRAYVIFHAGDFSNNRNRGDRITVTNVDPACRHADNVPRFLCVARLDLSVTSDRDRHDGRFRSASVRGGRDDCDNRGDNRFNRDRNRGRDRDRCDHHQRPPRPQPQPRVQNFSCVVALRIVGGPVVAPTTSVLAAECVRVRSTV